MPRKTGRSLILAWTLLWIATAAVAQNNQCDPGEEPDVIVGGAARAASDGQMEAAAGRPSSRPRIARSSARSVGVTRR